MATPRSSYRLDPELKRRVRERAKAEGISETDFVTAALEARLADDRKITTTRATRSAGPKEFRGPFPKGGKP
jgi:hypothetical protein